MRPFRNHLSVWLMLATGTMASAVQATQPAGQAAQAAQAAAQPAARPAVPSAKASAGNPWFPLAVGNSWSYRCSVEGNFQFNKTVRITAIVSEGAKPLFRTEQRVGKDTIPLVYFLGLADDGSVFKTLKAGEGTRESLIGAAPKVGDRVGDRTVAASERIRVPTLGKIEALRVENFPFDDAGLTPDKRAQWQARFYARGYGPVAESDGLGGECALSRAPVIVRR